MNLPLNLGVRMINMYRLGQRVFSVLAGAIFGLAVLAMPTKTAKADEDGGLGIDLLCDAFVPPNCPPPLCALFWELPCRPSMTTLRCGCW